MQKETKIKLKELLQNEFNAIDWSKEYIYQEARTLILAALDLGFNRMAKDFTSVSRAEGYNYKHLQW